MANNQVSRASAYHEAGHAVAAVICGATVEGLVAYGSGGGPPGEVRGLRVEDQKGITKLTCATPSPAVAGYAKAIRPAGAGPSWPLALMLVITTGAGPAAEARASRRGLSLVWRGRAAGGDVEAAESALAPYGLSPDERSALVRRVWRETRGLVTKRLAWAAVTDLAGRLLVSGEVAADEVAPIVGHHLADPPRLIKQAENRRAAHGR